MIKGLVILKLAKWLYPGMQVKRWLMLGAAGLVMVLAGGLLVFGNVYHLPPGWNLPASIFLAAAGLALIITGLFRAFRSVVDTLAPEKRVVDMVFNRRQLEKGPKIVVIGGGTGLSTLLRGLKEYTSNLTAVVTVTDDGGSSGRLRGDQGILPPGDVRNCLVALADKETVMESLLQYRFPSGELAGHNLGNLLLAGLTNINNGGFHEAVKDLSRVLAIRGQVLPVTLEDVQLCAEMEDKEIVCGESRISGSGKKINRVFLHPEKCYPVQEALQAIRCADAVILGPGSLYTSVLPNLLVQGIPEALQKSRALRIYVSNIMTQPGETEGYTASGHVKAILDHAGPVLDWAVVNKENIQARLLHRYRKEGAAPVQVDRDELEHLGVKVQAGYFAHEDEVVRHHPDRLARHILHLVLLHRDGAAGRVVPFYRNQGDRQEDREQKIVQ